MDLLALSNDGKPSLLTLPRQDLQNNSGTKSSSSFLLMQLPVGWNVDDLTDSKFISKPQQQVALVSEKKETSFLVSNVQSSNCFVLVPPLGDSDEHVDDCAEQVSKKAKRTEEPDENTKLRIVATRLLKPGGSGASFLELRPKVLKITDLQKALMNAKAVLDPYNNDDWKPSEVTVDDLAQDLQHSLVEIRRCLLAMEGVYVYTNNAGRESVLLLSEEKQLNVHQAIVSTLAEVDECQNYADTGVDVERCVKSIVERMSQEERFERDYDIVRYSLLRLAQKEGSEKDGCVKLDVSKIAKWVARYLFSLQSSPWEESLLFARWQSQIPGVGDSYKVSASMLQGVAVNSRNVACRDTHSECFWRYLPSDRIMTAVASSQACSAFEQVEKAFIVLFEWKECWTVDELQPYLDAMMDATASSQSDILLQHVRMTTETVDGCTFKMYKKR